jgi:serine/threonine protein kinase
MGMVWLAHDNHLNEFVALKFLPPQIRFDDAAIDLLRRETTRSRKLSHPNIIRIHDLHRHEGEDPFIAMEYVDGPTLHAFRFTRPTQAVSWTQLAPLTKQLCDALDYAHGERIIHRDLKPSNLMLDSNGRLKLADFGIAAVVSDSVARVSGAGAGTPAYMSPQQIDGKGPQATDDIYSLGATLYELLTSTPPFYQGQIVHQVLHNDPPSLTERLAELGQQIEIPADLEAMIMACLAKDPSRRPQSARAVADWISFQPTPHPKSLEATITPPEEFQPDAPGHSTRKGLAAAFTLLTLALLCIGGWLWKMKQPKIAMLEGNPLALVPASQMNSHGEAAISKPGQTILAIDFETSNAQGQPKGLKLLGGLPPGVKQSIKSEGGRRFVELESATSTNWLNPNFAALPLKPEWKKLKFSVRTRTRNLNCNPAFGKYLGAVLTLGWWDEHWNLRKDIPNATTEFVQTNTDWKVIENVVTIPPGVKNAGLEFNLGFASGIADFDDLRVTLVETNAPPAESHPAVATSGQIVFADDFEGDAGPNVKSPWNWSGSGEGTAGKSLVAENGNHFIRIQSEDWSKSCSVDSTFPLEPEWKKLGFSYRIRTKNIKSKPGQINSGADLFVVFADEKLKWLPGGGTPLIRLSHDTNWISRSLTWMIPARAKFGTMSLSLEKSRGIADFDDIKVTLGESTSAFAQTNAPHATQGGPIAATELLAPERVLLVEDFEHGKPRSSRGATFGGEGIVVAENGKHFLRLVGNDIHTDHEFFAILPLPPEWRDLMATVRIRVRSLKTNSEFAWSGARLAFDLLDEKN